MERDTLDSSFCLKEINSFTWTDLHKGNVLQTFCEYLQLCPLIFMARRFIPSRLGMFNGPLPWCVWFIIATNSSFSTSSNGWSQAMIHSVSRLSNFSWSHGPYETGIWGMKISECMQTLTAAHASCSWNAFLIFSDAKLSFFIYSAWVFSERGCLPDVIVISSVVGGWGRPFKTQ